MLLYVLSDKCTILSTLFKYFANKYPNEFNKINNYYKYYNYIISVFKLNHLNIFIKYEKQDKD